MSRWYRAYEGTVTDAKLAEAAVVADVSRSVSVASWHYLLESAATKNNCGGFDATARRVAVALCEPTERIEALLAAFTEIGLLDGTAIAAWTKRQYQHDPNDASGKHYTYLVAPENMAHVKIGHSKNPWARLTGIQTGHPEKLGVVATIVCDATGDKWLLDGFADCAATGEWVVPNAKMLALVAALKSKKLKTREDVENWLLNYVVGDVAATYTETETETELESSNEDSSSGDEPELRPEHVFEFYRELAVSIGRPAPRDFTPERRRLTRGRVAQYSLADFQTVFAKCRDSPFLRGDRGRTPLTYDWLMKKANFQKVLEGNYDG